MSNVEVRQYRVSDLEHGRSLWAQMTEHHREIYSDPTIGGDDPGLEFDQHLARVGTRRVWMAEVEGEVAGLAALMQNGQEAEVEPVCVSSKYRGQGVGRVLVEQVVQEAGRLGVLCLGVKPVARNQDAVRFFHSCGFTALGHIHMFMWLGEPAAGRWKRGPTLFGRPFEY